MTQAYQIHPIGIVRRMGQSIRIVVDVVWREALLGIDGFSHIEVFFWFHENDTPGARNQLQVRPRKNPKNPLTGVFATHAPVRPNLIGRTVCRLERIDDCTLYVDALDARDQTPVIDIKSYRPNRIDPSLVRLPDWAQR